MNARRPRPILLAPTGRGLVASREELSKALQAYQNAPERDARVTITAWNWGVPGRNGSLWGHAAEVMAACGQEVALAREDAGVRDSRGFARVL